MSNHSSFVRKLWANPSKYRKSGGTLVWKLCQKLNLHWVFFARRLTAHWEPKIANFNLFSWKTGPNPSKYRKSGGTDIWDLYQKMDLSSNFFARSKKNAKLQLIWLKIGPNTSKYRKWMGTVIWELCQKPDLHWVLFASSTTHWKLQIPNYNGFHWKLRPKNSKYRKSRGTLYGSYIKNWTYIEYFWRGVIQPTKGKKYEISNNSIGNRVQNPQNTENQKIPPCGGYF